MTKKELTQEQEQELAKIRADLDADFKREISHEEVKKWMDKARKVTLATLPDFMKAVHDDIPVSYGNICHKIGIAAIAAAYAFENSDQGGITGFQSGCVMWDFICAWTRDEKPQRLTHYENMLYPQYEEEFNFIDKETFKWLQEEAAKHLENAKTGGMMHPEVRAHMEKIVAGNVPFGYSLRER
jgi:hypothetical protein